MSEVISFRLNKNYPREARALMVLKSWQEDGHNIRYIVTEALLRMHDPDKNTGTEEMLDELKEKLTQLSQIIYHFGYNGTTNLFATNPTKLETGLSDGFIRGIRATAKTGISLKRSL